MVADYIEIGGKQMRVEVNFNAICAFLQAVGKDDMAAFANLGSLKPSDIAPLMAACINEGEAIEGREAHYTGVELGRICPFAKMTEFITIFTRQMSPARPDEAADGKKKD